MAQQGLLYIFSCGISMPDTVPAFCAGADHIFGSARLLENIPEGKAQRHTIRLHPVEDAKSAIELAEAGNTVAVLTSGDSLFHGFGGTLSRLLKQHVFEGPEPDICFHPGVTAFQALFSRLCLPWSEAEVISCHAEEPPLRRLAEAQLCVALGGTAHTAAQIAGLLARTFPFTADRQCILADRLGEEEEVILKGPLRAIAGCDCSATSMLLLLPNGAVSPALSLGLPDEAWEKDHHLITHPAVRAVVLSTLRLPAFGTLWDLGAGSGSVGLEARGLRPHLDVWGIEKNAGRFDMMKDNAKRLGLAGYHSLRGNILDVLPILPNPDRIFIGGGGKDLAAIVENSLQRLAPDGILVATSVTTESTTLLMTLFPEQRLSLTSLDISEERPMTGGWHKLVPANRIHIFSFCSPNTSASTR